MFGWSSKSISSVMQSRESELGWMVKGQYTSVTRRNWTDICATEWTNRLYLTALWSTVGVGVPLSSFYCYTVLAEQELTVAIAFTVRRQNF